jgi:uncharacterized protein (DUF1800 family)
MLSVKSLPDRFASVLLSFLAWAVACTASFTVSHAQINTSINESVWEMAYGLNPNQIQASWLANQLPAGTNPLLPNSQLQVSTFSSTSTTVSLTFPSVSNKLYTVQSTTSLNPTNWATVSGAFVVGDGTNKTLTVSKSAGAYFHVLVQDQSTANDGVSDWAKSYLGYTPSASISSQTSYTASTLATALSAQNIVTLTATDPTGSQPQSATTPVTNLAVITVSRSGYQLFSAITVPLQVTGTAVPGVDYTALPSSVTFPAGVNSVPLNVTPLYNSAQFSTTTVIVTAQAGGGYSLGNPSAASVLIYPSVIPAGTGLTGSYFSGANTTYAPTPPTAANLGEGVASYSYTRNANGGQAFIYYNTAATQPSSPFSPGSLVSLQFITGNLAGGTYDTNYSIVTASGTQINVALPGPASATSGYVVITPYNTPVLSRVDSTVDFVWNGAAPVTGIAAAAPFTVRWTGQVLANFSEPYYFSVKSTQGCRLWVNNQKIIDKWQTQGVTDQISTPITLQAGVFYDIKLEYLSTSATADEVHLQWYNNDMSEQVIPQSNLYPYITGFGAAAAAAVTSPVSVGYVYGTGVPFSYTITGSNAATGFSAGNLPSWLTLSGNTLTGTPPGAGTYQFTVTATNSGGSSTVVVTLTVVDPPGSISREIWTGLSGSNISNIPTSTTPNTTDTTLTTLEDAGSYSNNTGERLRGYFTAPVTGNYYFWIGASNAAELWISDDNQKVNLIRRAYVTGPTGTASRTWNSQTNQQSPWLSLVAGSKYYFEVLHNTGSSGSSSNLSVAWYLDPTGSSGGIANGLNAAQPSTGGIVPAAELWPWDNPPTTNTTGSIYLANLAPEATVSVPTSGSGGAYLSLNGSTAMLHVNYSGLTSGTLWRRIYTGTGTNQTLLFDLDAQDKNYPTLKTSDGGYTWTVSNLTPLTGGQAYLTIATVDNPSGELSGSFALTSGSQTPPTIPSYPSYTDDHTAVAGASRFLNQATFGASFGNNLLQNDISYVQTNGYRAWIENQFGLGPTTNEPYVLSRLSNDPQNPYQSTLFFNSWWKNSIASPDQLRQRLAFALSEIMVVSDNNSGLNNLAVPQASYYDRLLNDAFTNFSTLLYDVTLHPAMGNYLNMQGNTPGNIQTGLHPNENYAREIMQLFTIGLYRLWPDGSLVLDNNGDPIPTYNQSVITGMAAVMTGWTWGQAIQSNGRLPTGFYPATNWLDPMVLVPSQHSLISKLLLDNAVLPAATVTSSSSSATVSPGYTVQYTDPTLGQGNVDTTTVTNAYDANGLADLTTALGMLSNHANVGPFICRQLIQRLVESNPSPAYVYRVVRAFNGQYNVDGLTTGVVGDMKDTIRAILLDPEARNTSAAQSSIMIGKQREPLLRITGPARAFLPSGLSATYREINGQAMLITTTTPHRLTNNDVVQLDNVVDQTGSGNTSLYPPASTGYTVANVTPGYSVSGTTATISAPGYKTGDSVSIQFISSTSGTLAANSTYNVPANYTVTSATGTSFTITIGSGFSGATGTAYTPNNFTINNSQTGSASYNISGTTVTVSVSNTGLAAGNSIYLYFASGGLLGAGYDGVYSITSATTNNFTVTLASNPGTTTGGTAYWPQFTGGYTVTTSAGVSTITFQSNGTNDIQQGDSIWINFLVPLSPHGATSQQYTVQDTSATKSSLQPNEFTVQVSSTLTTGNESSNGYAAYPLTVASWNRHGTATLDFSTFGLGYTSQFIQTPLDSPTVFNFFYPNYQYPGAMAAAGMTVPEFELTNASSTMTLTNSINQAFPNSSGNQTGFTSFNGNGSIMMDLSSYMTAGQTATQSSLQTLTGTLSALLAGGYVSSTTQSSIASYVSSSVTGTAISSGTTGNPATINLATPHGLAIGSQPSVTISGVSGFSALNGTFTATVTTPTQFTVPVNYTGGGNLSSASFTVGTAGVITQPLMRDRVRAIVQLIITSAEYAIQK